MLILRLLLWPRKLLRRPWYCLLVTDDFEIEEAWFWLESAAKAWVESKGKDEDGSRPACYAFMWSFPRREEVVNYLSKWFLY